MIAKKNKKKIVLGLILVIMVFYLLKLVTKHYYYYSYSDVIKTCKNLSIELLMNDVKVDDTEVVFSPLLAYRIKNKLYNNGKKVGELSSTFVFNHVVTSEVNYSFAGDKFRYPNSTASALEESDVKKLSNSFVAYVSFDDFYELPYLYTIIKEEDDIKRYAVNCVTSNNYYNDEKTLKSYTDLYLSNKAFSKVWKNVKELETQGDIAYIEVTSIHDRYNLYSDYLQENFIKNLSYLKMNIGFNSVMDHKQFLDDCAYIEQNGIEIYGVVIEDNTSLINRLLDSGIVGHVEYIEKSQ